ncbi:hypothetical protein D0Z07_9219 [Hyphodiscus hymeniophilus]|uniref:Uncharacterized protein n=1 Tax=Hyphodiscus hymeniophilus TaxID=353542 RepID=A0A9P6SPZ1_9HELO|nr:hypothetical protein D0Z07_9219 [Hyphodiscus hymeniophilus]
MQSEAERKTWTSPASEAKLRFQEQSRLYKETKDYLLYQEYLQDFKNQYNLSGQGQRSSEARNEETDVDKPPDSTRDSASRQWGQIIPYATGGNTQAGSEQNFLPKVDRSDAIEHSSPATPLRPEYAIRNRAVSDHGYEENPNEDTNSLPATMTTRFQGSQYFRTVLST